MRLGRTKMTHARRLLETAQLPLVLSRAVPVASAAYEHIRQADWTFSKARTGDGPHAIHPYPAKFIPQIPRALIESLYHGDGTFVLDPFCGSGTTLVEAASAGAPAIGIDLHPLACLISKVKVTPLREGLGDVAEAIAARARRSPTAPPAIPALDHWFRSDVQHALAALVAEIGKTKDADQRDALKVALSSIIVRVSNQDSDTRYAAVEKAVGKDDVYTLFAQAAASVERAIGWRHARRPKVEIIHSDVLAVAPQQIGRKVSLVVTSPPYPNAYEYWLYHKYRMYWLNMDPIAVREQEIGARPHYFKRNPQTPADFERQMGTVFRLLSAVVVRGGHVCVQIGRSIIHGETIDNAAMLRRVADKTCFVEAVTVTRTIPSHRKSFNLHHARIAKEHILVFRSEAP